MRHAIRRHALGLGILLFLIGAVMAWVPVEKSGFGCGSIIFPDDDTLRRVEVATPEGDIIELPEPDDVEARDDCHAERSTRTTLVVAFVVAGLVGVFWSVVASPDLARSRRERSRILGE